MDKEQLNKSGKLTRKQRNDYFNLGALYKVNNKDVLDFTNEHLKVLRGLFPAALACFKQGYQYASREKAKQTYLGIRKYGIN